MQFESRFLDYHHNHLTLQVNYGIESTIYLPSTILSTSLQSNYKQTNLFIDAGTFR